MDVSALIVDWGVSARVQRFNGSENLSGRMSGSFVSVATQVIWLQPYDKRRNRGAGTRGDAGIIDDTTHEAFWRYSGYEMEPEDRLIVAGETYQYDVLTADRPENYRHAWIKLTERA